MRLSFSKVAPLIGGAVLAGLGATANAQSLTIDLRILSAGGVAPNGSTVTAHAATAVLPTQTVVMGVYADVTGAQYATFGAAQGSFISNNAGATGEKGNLLANPLAPYRALGFNAGTVSDVDGDGDNDLAPGSFIARSAVVIGGTDQTNTTFGTGATVTTTGNVTEFRIATLQFIVTSLGTAANISFIPNVSGTASTYFVGATKNSYNDGFNDNVTYGFDDGDNGGTGTSPGTQGSAFSFPAANTVVVGVAGNVPEPTSLGLLGLAGAGLVARRRKA